MCGKNKVIIKIVIFLLTLGLAQAQADTKTDKLLLDGEQLSLEVMELIAEMNKPKPRNDYKVIKKARLTSLSPIEDNAEYKEPVVIKEWLPYDDLEQSRIDYDLAEEYFARHEEAKAVAVLQEILNKHTIYHRARIKLIVHYRNNEQFDEAEHLLRAGLEIVPDHPDYLMLLSDLLIRQGSYKSGLTWLVKVPESHKQTKTYHALAATAYYHEGLYDMAYDYYHKLVLAEKNHTSWWLGQALCLQAKGEVKQAINSYKRVLKTGGISAELLKFVEQEIGQLIELEISPGHEL